MHKQLDSLKKHWWVVALIGAGIWHSATLYFEFRTLQKDVAELRTIVHSIYYVPRGGTAP